MKKVILLSVICFLQAAYMSAQIVSSKKSTVHINNKPKEQAQEQIRFRAAGDDTKPIVTGKYYALVIGIQNYTDPQFPRLENPIRDAQMFYNAITSKYTFNEEDVKFLKDATNTEIEQALEDFSKKIKSDDSFVIFYAGHGYLDEAANNGYWIPVNAVRNSRTTWFRNSVLRDWLREIRSKHILLISDACFGGSIFTQSRSINDASQGIKKLYDLPSKKAMTSGTKKESVSDESAFLKYLVIRLVDNKEKFLPSGLLFSSFSIAVMNNSSTVPQYGVIQDVGDEGGDFIFILRE
jgi:hypothetical protein